MTTTTVAPTPSLKIALVTGGSRGIGRAAALHLARQGFDVLLTFRSQADEAADVVSQIEALGRRALALPLDMGSTAGFAAFADQVQTALSQHFGRPSFDALVNNAGAGAHAPLAETTEAQFDQMLNIHLKGVLFLTQRLLPLLAESQSIVYRMGH